METLIPLIIQLVSGGIGGNIAGIILKKFTLGAMGNSLAGIVGGVIGGQFVDILSAGGLDGIVGDILAGGAGGGILMVAIGLIKKMMNK